MSVPEEDRMSYTEKELRDRLVVYMGGRAAEQIVYDELLVGAQNDIERATGIARHMVMDWGMSKKIGPVSFKTGEDDPFLGREIQQQRNFSEHTMEIIDEEVSHIIEEAMLRAKDLLNQHRGLLDQLTKQLVEREELDNDEIRKILGPSAQETRPDWVAAFDIAQTPNSETNGSVSESNLPETETHPPG